MIYLLLALSLTIQVTQFVYFLKRVKALESAPKAELIPEITKPALMPEGTRSAFSILYGNP